MSDASAPAPAAAAVPAAGQAARWAGQRERRRVQMVDAALEVIAEVGPGATVEQIAARAGVARTRIYRHFNGLADLENAISERVGALIIAELTPLLRATGSARQIIEAIIGGHAGWLAANRHLYGYLLAHPGSAVPDPAVPDPAVPDTAAQDTAAQDPAVAGRADPAGGAPVPAAAADGIFAVRRAVGEHLADLISGYFGIVGVSGEASETMAFGLVGMVEAVTTRALERPGPFDNEALTQLLAGWVWAMFDATLRSVGVVLDPDFPLPPLR